MKVSRRQWVIVGVQGALLAVELGWGFDDLSRRIALGVTNSVATLGILWVDRSVARRGERMPTWILLFGLGAVWLDAFGNFDGWYSKLWWWDRVTHTTGGAALSLMAAEFWRARVGVGAAWVGLALGQMIGAWYEVSEYLGDLIFGTRRIGGSYDSPRDLCLNLVGGVVAIWLWRVVTRRKNMV